MDLANIVDPNGRSDSELTFNCSLNNTAVICPHCGIGHKLGSIRITGEYVLDSDVYVNAHNCLIMPKLSALLPIDPDTYDDCGKPVSVNCYNCHNKMLIIPQHLLNAIESFNNQKLFTTGTYFEQSNTSEKAHAVLHCLWFKDVNFLLTALMDRLEHENITIDPVPGCDVDAKGIPLVWCFDVSATKDQFYSSLNDIEIVREKDGHLGSIQFDPTYKSNICIEVSIAEASETFVDALMCISEFVGDWTEWMLNPDLELFKDTTSDPFREFYRSEYRTLSESHPTMADSFNWFLDDVNKFDYPPMS